jgi:bifunctional DNA-binding transcriptional regulator/antitoxin component of YhaV-PrlF toxin-antitoxin module
LMLTYIVPMVILVIMKTEQQSTTVAFSVKGQVVIPRWLRREYEIHEGTRAHVEATKQGILIKPLTAKHIHGIRGSLKGSRALEILMTERKRERDL